MRLLLDTHAFLWIVVSPEKVSSAALSAYQEDNEVFVSLASFWEIQIKRQLRKFHFDLTLNELFYDKDAFTSVLPIELSHILTLEKLPFHHKDPFDRLLIAQAIREKMTLISSDRIFSQYPVSRLW